MLKMTLETEGLELFTAEKVEHFFSRVFPGETLTEGAVANSSVTRLEVLVHPGSSNVNLLEHFTPVLNNNEFKVNIYSYEKKDEEAVLIYTDVFTEFSTLALTNDSQGLPLYQLQWSKDNNVR